jgi:hypothetical protein
MCQAAAEGVVDFTRGDPRDIHWWINLNIALDHVEGRNADVIRRLHHATTLALLSRTDLNEESTEGLRKHADSLVLEHKKSLFPWVDFDESAGLNRAIDDMSKAWAAEWGDPNSPETQAKIEATARMLAAQVPTAPASDVLRKPTPRPKQSPRPRRRPGRA